MENAHHGLAAVVQNVNTFAYATALSSWSHIYIPCHACPRYRDLAICTFLFSILSLTSQRKFFSLASHAPTPPLLLPYLSYPAIVEQNGLEFVHRHAAVSKSPHLRSFAQLLQALNHLPILLFAVDENIAFALLVPDAGAQDVEALVLTGLDKARCISLCGKKM